MPPTVEGAARNLLGGANQLLTQFNAQTGLGQPVEDETFPCFPRLSLTEVCRGRMFCDLMMHFAACAAAGRFRHLLPAGVRHLCAGRPCTSLDVGTYAPYHLSNPLQSFGAFTEMLLGERVGQTKHPFLMGLVPLAGNPTRFALGYTFGWVGVGVPT